MRQAINNLQSTHSGFGLINKENVFKGIYVFCECRRGALLTIVRKKVCDMPQPHKIHDIIQYCLQSDVDRAVLTLNQLWAQGYSALDIIGTLFKVLKTYDMPEYLKLEYIKVRILLWL